MKPICLSMNVATGSYANGIAESVSQSLKNVAPSTLFTEEDVPIITGKFPDGEVYVTLQELENQPSPSVWHLYHRFPIEEPLSVDSGMQEVLLAAHVLKSLGGAIVLHCPFLPYTRSDRPDLPHSRPAVSPIIAQQLRNSGIERIVTLPAGNISRIRACYLPIEIQYEPVLDSLIDSFTVRPEIIIGPDAGSEWITRGIGEQMKLEWACAKKRRHSPSSVTVSLDHMPQVKSVMIVDDLVSTGSTLRAVVEKLQATMQDIKYIGFRGIHYRPNEDTELESIGCSDIGFLTVPVTTGRGYLI